ncbi:MAG TPA: hypothetical protein ENN80_12055, partial [Candidatus Hydrogenedentes bacterium]|nr:hypothetical protein [Candidatus Hydrogenedentota bacterium]
MGLGVEHDRPFQILEGMIVCVAVVFVLLGTYARSFGDTANSRLATVLSLTEHGTWYIDWPLGEAPNYFEQRTIDKVMVKGRLLSSKPPILPLLMTGEYVVMNRLLGWELLEEGDRGRIIRWMSMTLIGGAYLGALVFFMKTLRLFDIEGLARVVLVFSLAFGTQLWGYGSNINNHVPGAGALVVALYFALGLGSGRLEARAWRFALFGFFGGLAPTLDLPAAIFVAVAGFFVLARHPRLTLLFVLPAAAIPIGVQTGILLAVTGSPLPVQLHPEAYLYEASYWRNPRGIDALNEPKAAYLFHMTFGRCGLFSLYPILLAGMAGAV